MKREFLKQLNLTDEVIEKIMSEYGKSVERLKTEDPDLKSKLENLQGKYDKDTQELKNMLEKEKFNSALSAALSKSGAKNEKALLGLIDISLLSFENGKLSGFDEQLEQIKAENDFLFNSQKMSTGISQGSGSNLLSGVEAAFYAKNPDLLNN